VADSHGGSTTTPANPNADAPTSFDSIVSSVTTQTADLGEMGTISSLTDPSTQLVQYNGASSLAASLDAEICLDPGTASLSFELQIAGQASIQAFATLVGTYGTTGDQDWYFRGITSYVAPAGISTVALSDEVVVNLHIEGPATGSGSSTGYLQVTFIHS
ncbi:MAG: hypothetical protein ACRDYC_02875, partial [Acidimicrobiales bacterium]